MVPKLLLIAIFGLHQITVAHQQQHSVTLLPSETSVTENILRDDRTVVVEQRKKQTQNNEESKQEPLTFRYGYSIIGQNDSMDQRSEYQWGANTLGNYFVQLPDGESKSKVEYTADNLGFHPVVRFEVKNNQSELTSHFAIGENAVKSLNDNNKSTAKVNETPSHSNIINFINNKSNIKPNNISFSIKCTISSSKDNITSFITEESNETFNDENDENCKGAYSNNDETNTSNFYGNKITSQSNPIVDEDVDKPSFSQKQIQQTAIKAKEESQEEEYEEEDDGMFFFSRPFGDIFKSRITEYLSNASKSHPEIFKTSKAVPHMNEVFHYLNVHPSSEIDSDYRENKTFNNEQANNEQTNNYETEDFNKYQSISGLDNWITEYLEGTKSPETSSNYDDDLQALPTHVTKIKDNSTVSFTNETLTSDLVIENKNTSDLVIEHKTETNQNSSKDIVSDFTGFISDEDVLNINDAAEEYIATAESQKPNATITSLPFLPTVNSILDNFKSFDEIIFNKNFKNNSSPINYTFNTPIIVNDNFGTFVNSTHENLQDNDIADSNAIHSNTYLNPPNEVQIIPSREKFISIPRSQSTKQINVEILKEKIKPAKKLFVPAKELDESHENEERSFSKEHLGPVIEAPSRRFLKHFKPKYDESRVEFTKITEIEGTTKKENLVVTPNRQYKTLPPPFYSTTEPNKFLSSSTQIPPTKRSSRGKTFVEIQKSVNVHNMLIQEQDGKFLEQHEEYRKPYKYGEKVIKIDTQPQQLSHTFSTSRPIIVEDKYLEPVTVSHPSKVLPVPYPVEIHKTEYIPVEKSIPVYINTPASTPPPNKVLPVPYPVEVHTKEYIPIEKKVPVYLKTPAPPPAPNKVLPVPYPVEIHTKEYIPIEKKIPVYLKTPSSPPAPSKVISVPYPVEVPTKEFIPFEKKVPIYISTPAPPPPPNKIVSVPYPVEERTKEFVPVEKKIPIYISTPAPYPVEVPKPFPVEKIIERPVHITEKIPIYVNNPYPVEKIVEKTVPVPVPVEKVVEKYVDRPYPVIRPYPVHVEVQKIVEKEVPIQEIVQVPYPVKVPEFIPQPYPVEKIVEKIVDRPVEKVVEKEVKVPYPVVIKKTIEKPVEKFVDRPVPYAVPIAVEVPIDRPYPVETIVPFEKIVEKPVKVEVEKIVEKPVKVEIEKIVEKIVARPVTVEKVVEKIVDRPVTVEKIINRAILIPVQVPVPYPVPTAPTYQSHDYHSPKGNFYGKSNALHTDFNLPIINNHYPTAELYTLLQPTPPHQNALNFYNQPSGPSSNGQQIPVSVTLLPKRQTYSFAPKYTHTSHPLLNNIRFGKSLSHKPMLPPAILHHSIQKVIANDYIGPVPAESEKSFWIVAPGPGSRGLYKRSSDFEKNLRVEYGFKPPLVPSVEIDDQGQPIEKKD